MKGGINIAFAMGKILSIDYKLVDKGKTFAIAVVELQTSKKNKVDVIFKNDSADYVFRNLEKEQQIMVYGKIIQTNEKTSIEAERAERIF